MVAASGTYYSRNKGRAKRYYLDNRDKILAYQNAYNNSNVERLMWQGAKDRAKAKGIPFDLDLEDIVIPELCPVFRLPFNRGTARNQHDLAPTLDRFVPALGYVKGNVCVISRIANMIKSTATTQQVQAVADWMKQKEEG